MTGRVIQFRTRPDRQANSAVDADRILTIPREERIHRAAQLGLDDPERLLSICAALKSMGETSPARVREEAEYFYDFLEAPVRPIGLFDERDYFLGEMALLAGAACRMLFRRDEARRWFDRSEAAFRQTINPVCEWARVTYQRLALRVEERDFEPVLELLPSLIQTFQKLSMTEDALKARFLEGVSLINLERFNDAIELFREISREAERLGNERLLGIACNNLVQLHALVGDSETSLEQAQQTLQLLDKLDNRVGLAKLRWGIGTLLRSKGNLASAIEAYRAAQNEFVQLGMRSDVAAMHLVLADIFLESGDETSSARHVMEALPIIQEERMVPEGMAALALLEESLRQKRVNAAALRELHGYFRQDSPNS